MTPTPSPPTSRWPRFIPRQFSLRALLVMVTSAAIFLGWSLQNPRGVINERQAAAVIKGMTKNQVWWTCGNCFGEEKHSTWAYQIQGDPNRHYFINFDATENRVSSIEVVVIRTLTGEDIVVCE